MWRSRCVWPYLRYDEPSKCLGLNPWFNRWASERARDPRSARNFNWCRARLSVPHCHFESIFFCLLVTSTIRSTISVLMWWAWWFPVFFLSLWNSDRNKEKKIPQIRLVQQSRTNTRHRKTRKMLRKRVHKETSLSRWAPFFESLPGSIHDSRFRDKSHDITLWQWSCRKVSDASECVCCVCCPFRGWSLIDSKKVFSESHRGAVFAIFKTYFHT